MTSAVLKASLLLILAAAVIHAEDAASASKPTPRHCLETYFKCATHADFDWDQGKSHELDLVNFCINNFRISKCALKQGKIPFLKDCQFDTPLQDPEQQRQADVLKTLFQWETRVCPHEETVKKLEKELACYRKIYHYCTLHGASSQCKC